MKNSIDEIIHAFSGDELREFKYFLERRKNYTHERKDSELTNQIRKNPDKPIINKRAYHSTRQRLKSQIEQFSALENLKYDDASKILNMVEVAKYLFRKNLYNQAWNYLIEAEQMAMEKEEYLLLDSIYYIQIAYSSLGIYPVVATPVVELLNKRNKNLPLAKMDGDANAAYTHLIYEMGNIMSEKIHFDIDVIVNKILKQYQLDGKVYDNPRIYYRIVNIVCRAFRLKKDYQSLKQYSINSYRIIQRKKMSDRIPPEFMMELLSELFISSLRTKDYENAEKFQKIYDLNTVKFKTQHDKYAYYYLNTCIYYADLCMCTGYLDKVKKQLLLLDKEYSTNQQKLKPYFMLRININLLAMHFKNMEYTACIRILNDILQKNQLKVLKETGLGIEIILFTEIYMVILYYEQHDTDYALNLLKKIKRKHAAILGKSLKREILFIHILEKMIPNSSYIKSEEFIADHDKFTRLKDFIPGDKEYISLNAWLSSRLTNKTYYECFLELVK